jgi:CRISPR-associated endonuclease/helicase Cas3
MDPESPARRSLTAQLAAENWDAPIVVSTNVQLFESLFSAHGSTCRKLHRLAGSVIVLDEAQAVPPLLLRPVLAAIDELVRNYRCSVVLCTATQPAITQRENFPIGLSDVTEIIPEPKALYRAMQRVQVSDLGPTDDDVLAERLAGHEQVLCIVNTRKHAAELTRRLSAVGKVVHLSAAMCPQHRSQRVAQIKEDLKNHRPCRVVSTQVIEAGVDVDFPVVYRALAGFDSIAQAAGRCNREGRQKQGQVYVFDTDHPPALSMRPQVHAASELLPDHPDPLALDAIERYFGLVYWKHQHHGLSSWDYHDVMGCFEKGGTSNDVVLNFREADRRFRWIDQQTTPVVVPYGDAGQAIVDQLRNHDEQPDWRLLRRAQRYSVAVYKNQLELLQDNTLISPGSPDLPDGADKSGFWLLTNPEAYDDLLGLRFDVAGWDAGTLIG